MSDGIVLVLADIVSTDEMPYTSIFAEIVSLLFRGLVRSFIGFGIILGLLTFVLIVTGFVFYSKRKAQRDNESFNGIKQYVFKVLPVGIAVAFVVCVVSVIFSPLKQVENNVVYRPSHYAYVHRDNGWFLKGSTSLITHAEAMNDISLIEAEPWKYYFGKFDKSDECMLTNVGKIGKQHTYDDGGWVRHDDDSWIR